MLHRLKPKRCAFSFLELLAVVTLLGIIAAVLVPYMIVSSGAAKFKARDHHQATINAAVEHYYVDHNVWPANEFSDVGSNSIYFPDGIPVNPMDGSAYTLNATTHRVD